MTEAQITLTKEQMMQFYRLSDLLSHKLPSGDPNEIIAYLLDLGLERHDPVRQEARSQKRKQKQEAKNKKKKKKKKKKDVQECAEKQQSLQTIQTVQVTKKKSTLTSGNDASFLDRSRNDALKKNLSETPKKSSTSREIAITQKAPPKNAQNKAVWDEMRGKYVRILIPAPLRRSTFIRDGVRCTEVDPLTGVRCESSRFLDIDHRVPVSEGGTNEERNLTVRCSQHNRSHYRSNQHKRSYE
jgi:hypothetical protein